MSKPDFQKNFLVVGNKFESYHLKHLRQLQLHFSVRDTEGKWMCWYAFVQNTTAKVARGVELFVAGNENDVQVETLGTEAGSTRIHCPSRMAVDEFARVEQDTHGPAKAHLKVHNNEDEIEAKLIVENFWETPPLRIRFSGSVKSPIDVFGTLVSTVPGSQKSEYAQAPRI